MWTGPPGGPSVSESSAGNTVVTETGRSAPSQTTGHGPQQAGLCGRAWRVGHRHTDGGRALSELLSMRACLTVPENTISRVTTYISLNMLMRKHCLPLTSRPDRGQRRQEVYKASPFRETQHTRLRESHHRPWGTSPAAGASLGRLRPGARGHTGLGRGTVPRGHEGTRAPGLESMSARVNDLGVSPVSLPRKQ